MHAQLTKHASTRCQQRAVPPIVVDWLLEYGAVAHDHRGAEVRFFDKKGKKRLSSSVGERVVSRLGNVLDTYLITKGSTVITIGYRFKRICLN